MMSVAVVMGGVEVVAIPELIAGITVGIMLIKDTVMMHIHVVERCVLIIMITGIAIAAEVVMVADHIGTVHITIDVAIVTPRIVQMRDTRTRKGNDPPVKSVIGTSQEEKIRNLKVIEGSDLGHLEDGRKGGTIAAQTVAVLQVVVMIVENQLT